MRTSLTWLGYTSILGLLALGGVGCSGGEQLNPVRGKVVYKGKPIAGALVTLHPRGNTDMKVVCPTGLTKEDGTFAVCTGQKDGAPAGEYVVTMICSVTPPGAGGKKKTFSTGEVDPVDLFGGAYANTTSSKLGVVVKAGNNELEAFDLK